MRTCNSIPPPYFPAKIPSAIHQLNVAPLESLFDHPFGNFPFPHDNYVSATLSQILDFGLRMGTSYDFDGWVERSCTFNRHPGFESIWDRADEERRVSYPSRVQDGRLCYVTENGIYPVRAQLPDQVLVVFDHDQWALAIPQCTGHDRTDPSVTNQNDVVLRHQNRRCQIIRLRSGDVQGIEGHEPDTVQHNGKNGSRQNQIPPLWHQ